MARDGEMTWLPEQHEEQLQLGFRIIDNAFKNKIHSLEQEIRALRLTNEEKTQQVTVLQKKNSSLEVELIESHQRTQQLSEENKELFRTVQALKKQVSRLDDLKKTLMASLSDVEQQAVEDASSLLMSEEYLRSAVPLTAASVTGVPYPRQADAPSPQGNALRGSATSLGGGGDAGLGSPGAGVDGKQFFRNARARLSYEAFNSFLANIKRLNNHQQTRDETLDEAQRIFGSEHADLYREFVQLLNRHA
mmetsp:Transcript_16531/g.40923  ORF Transcript_16531/g.40923 Transcript_16531/m.40923 type:complete len:249 (+) Transcript_16531:131-877(+)|eukprot:CAMPEP_0179007022 /NCGR_PEP_ID=MMETSP0795-20121207/14909_1 /TAXON_ID=88552 /ORGANISM="Amoebophrya sp., Strain Ameob2" /LENGTH=248 /DNA_ID=CAMNT_0020701909 /DNA_START=82 /DNA_END=828 /DNA_ORIENTATION=+